MLLHISWDMEKNLPAILLGWQNLLELTSWWGDEQCPGQISDSSKRLVLFAPYEEEWSVVTGKLE